MLRLHCINLPIIVIAQYRFVDLHIHPRFCHFGGRSFFNVVGLAWPMAPMLQFSVRVSKGSHPDALRSCQFMSRMECPLSEWHQDDPAFFVTVPIEAGNCWYMIYVSRICLDIKMRLVSKISSRFGNFGDLWQLLASLRSLFRWSWSTDLVHWTLRNPWAADLEWCRHWCCGHLDWLPKATRLPAGRCGHPGRLES